MSIKRLSIIDNDISEIKYQLQLKASLKELRECVTRKHNEEAITALGNEIELKSSNVFTNMLLNKVEVIKVMKRDF